MASPPFAIAETVPADNDIASQYPSAERTFRDNVESWLLVNHDTSGKHKFLEITDLASDPSFASGVIGIWQNAGSLKTRLASGAINKIDAFPTSTTLLFLMASPPVGWSLNTTYTDRVIRVGSTGAGTGGNWTLSGVQADGHSISIAEMAFHSHDIFEPAGVEGVSTAVGGSGLKLVRFGAPFAQSGPIGSGAPHTHTVSNPSGWRPSYVDAVVGVKA